MSSLVIVLTYFLTFCVHPPLFKASVCMPSLVRICQIPAVSSVLHQLQESLLLFVLQNIRDQVVQSPSPSHELLQMETFRDSYHFI